MPISQTTITGSVKTPDDKDAQITSIEFKLNGSDFEGTEQIAANKVTGTVTTANGDFEVDLWPNDKGRKGTTTYAVTAKFDDGSSITEPKTVVIRHSDTPRQWSDVTAENELSDLFKGYKGAVVTAAGYAALTPKAPNTIYAVKG